MEIVSEHCYFSLAIFIKIIQILPKNLKKYLIGPDNLQKEDSASRTVKDVGRFIQIAENS